jgi:hypothetical protein
VLQQVGVAPGQRRAIDSRNSGQRHDLRCAE